MNLQKLAWGTNNALKNTKAGSSRNIEEKVYFKSQILERPSIGEYWNIYGVPVLPENVIFTFFLEHAGVIQDAYNTGKQKWSSIVQYSCTSIWDLKYTFSNIVKYRLCGQSHAMSRSSCLAVDIDQICKTLSLNKMQFK